MEFISFDNVDCVFNSFVVCLFVLIFHIVCFSIVWLICEASLRSNFVAYRLIYIGVISFSNYVFYWFVMWLFVLASHILLYTMVWLIFEVTLIDEKKIRIWGCDSSFCCI